MCAWRQRGQQLQSEVNTAAEEEEGRGQIKQHVGIKYEGWKEMKRKDGKTDH